MRKLFLFIAAATMIAVAGCANTKALNTVDEVVEVSSEYRALRVCLMAAGVVEVMTDRIQVFDSSKAPEALGRLISLQGAIDTAKLASPLWMNTDMADVAIQLGAVLKDVGREKLSRILFSGPTIGNFIDVAKRATLLAVKGDAILSDINNMLHDVQAGMFDQSIAWRACESRMYKNRAVLSILSGVRP